MAKKITVVVIIIVLLLSAVGVYAELCDPEPHPSMVFNHYEHTLIAYESCWEHINCTAEYWRRDAIYKCSACDLMEPIGSPYYYYLHSNPD